MNRLSGLAFVFLGLASTSVQANDDSIFHSGTEPGLRIDGRVYWPGPIANAIVTAQLNGQPSASTSSRPDGTYGLVIEYRHVTGSPLVELRAIGTGSRAHIQYAGQLGPFDRIQAAAGSDETLTLNEEAFVNLTPYSTAVTAHMRAGSGFNAVTNASSFDHAARSLQWVYSNELTVGLALAAQGDLALPAGSVTTWDALTSLASTQQFYADHMNMAIAASGCSASPATHPYCIVMDTLPSDPNVFPHSVPAAGTVHSNALGYRYWGGHLDTAFEVNGASGRYQPSGVLDAVMATVDVTEEPNGVFKLHHTDNSPISSYETYVFVNGNQVLRVVESLSVRVRLSRSAGNLQSFATANQVRWRHPNNPEIPDTLLPVRLGLPAISTASPPPADQLAGLGPLAGRRWLISTPFFAAATPSLTADIHAFGSSGGTTERGLINFSLVEQHSDRFVLSYGSKTVTTRLINQDRPDVWRTQVTIEDNGNEQIASGILMAVDDPQPAWTTASAPGLYRSYVNGQFCDGPYGDIELLYANGFCMSTQSTWFGFQLNTDGTAVQDPLNFPTPHVWSLPTSPNSGRLYLNRYSGVNLIRSRGWEIIRQDGDQYWVLENYDIASGPPLPGPANFLPTERVIQYVRQ